MMTKEEILDFGFMIRLPDNLTEGHYFWIDVKDNLRSEMESDFQNEIMGDLMDEFGERAISLFLDYRASEEIITEFEDELNAKYREILEDFMDDNWETAWADCVEEILEDWEREKAANG